MINPIYKLKPFENDVVELFKTTRSTKIVAEKYGVSPKSVVRFLKPRGFTFSKAKYSINQTYFDEIDTQEKAYILGYLYADGHNNGKGVVRLSLHEKDVEILYQINQHLGHTKPVRFGQDRGTGRMCEIEIANRHIANKLNGYGMVPRKTFILEYPKWINSNLQWHFIRGYFDGDGSVSITKPYGKMRSPVCQAAFVGTESFCNDLCDILKKEIDVNCYISIRHPERNNTTRQMQIGGNLQAKRFLDRLYLDSRIHLSRKYNIYWRHYYAA